MSTEWYPWYPVLFEADTLHLTPEQDGIYRRLIDWYMTKRRPLPDNDQALAAIARIGIDLWMKNADVIRPFFKRVKDTLQHKRCNTELDRQDRYGSTRSEVARKGGEARQRKRRKNSDLPASSTKTTSRKQKSSKLPAGNRSASASQNSATQQDNRGQENRREDNQSSSGGESGSIAMPKASQARPDPPRVTDGFLDPSLAPVPKRATRLLADWALPDEWRAAALAKRAEFDLREINLNLEAEKFRNYFCGLSGAKGTKLDWRGTWINWALRANENGKGHAKPDDTARRRAGLAGAYEARFGNGAGQPGPDQSEGADGEAGSHAGPLESAGKLV